MAQDPWRHVNQTILWVVFETVNMILNCIFPPPSCPPYLIVFLPSFHFTSKQHLFMLALC